MANKPTPADFSPTVPDFPSIGQYQPIYGKFDLTTYIQGASDYEIMAFLVQCYNATLKGYSDVTQLSKDTVTAYNQLQTWVNTWFDELDVQQEINNKLQSMYEAGTLATAIAQSNTIPPAVAQYLNSTEGTQNLSNVTAQKIEAMSASGALGTVINNTGAVQNTTTNWLTQNVTPTGSAVMVDKSLTIEGAAADSKETGEIRSNLNSYTGTLYRKTGKFTQEEITNLNGKLSNITEPITANLTEEDTFTDKAFEDPHSFIHIIYGNILPFPKFFFDIARRHSDGAIRTRYSSTISTSEWIEICCTKFTSSLLNNNGMLSDITASDYDNKLSNIPLPICCNVKPSDDYTDKAFSEEHALLRFIYADTIGEGKFFVDVARRHSDGAIKMRYSSLHDTQNWINVFAPKTPTLNRYVAFGDSITEGYIRGDPKTGVFANPTYPQYIANRNSLEVTNKAVGGQGWFIDANNSGKTGAEAILGFDFSGYDVVTISFGINDYNVGTQQLSEIKAKMLECLEHIVVSNPHITIIGLSPIQSFRRSDYIGPTKNHSNGRYTLSELSNTMKEAYSEYNVPYVDALNEFCISVHNQAQNLEDYLHPNEYGYNMLGAFMAGKFGSLYSAKYN